MRSRDASDAKVEHITARGSANSDVEEPVTVKFLQTPGVPLVEASVSVTLTLYDPAGKPF